MPCYPQTFGKVEGETSRSGGLYTLITNYPRIIVFCGDNSNVGMCPDPSFSLAKGLVLILIENKGGTIFGVPPFTCLSQGLFLLRAQVTNIATHLLRN